MNRRPTASPQGDWTKCLVPLRLRVCFYHPECMGKFTFRATNGVQFSSRLLLQSVSLYLCLSLSDVHDWIAPSPSPLTTTCSTRPGLPSSGPSCSTDCACVCPLVRACVLVPVQVPVATLTSTRVLALLLCLCPRPACVCPRRAQMGP